MEPTLPSRTVTHAARRLSLVPTRSLLPDAPREPGVYRSPRMLGGRWVYYALGYGEQVLDVRRARYHETDADVVAQLDEVLAQHRERELDARRPSAVFSRGLLGVALWPRARVVPDPRP